MWILQPLHDSIPTISSQEARKTWPAEWLKPGDTYCWGRTDVPEQIYKIPLHEDAKTFISRVHALLFVGHKGLKVSYNPDWLKQKTLPFTTDKSPPKGPWKDENVEIYLVDQKSKVGTKIQPLVRKEQDIPIETLELQKLDDQLIAHELYKVPFEGVNLILANLSTVSYSIRPLTILCGSTDPFLAEVKTACHASHLQFLENDTLENVVKATHYILDESIPLCPLTWKCLAAVKPFVSASWFRKVVKLKPSNQRILLPIEEEHLPDSIDDINDDELIKISQTRNVSIPQLFHRNFIRSKLYDSSQILCLTKPYPDALADVIILSGGVWSFVPIEKVETIAPHRLYVEGRPNHLWMIGQDVPENVMISSWIKQQKSRLIHSSEFLYHLLLGVDSNYCNPKMKFVVRPSHKPIALTLEDTTEFTSTHATMDDVDRLSIQFSPPDESTQPNNSRLPSPENILRNPLATSTLSSLPEIKKEHKPRFVRPFKREASTAIDDLIKDLLESPPSIYSPDSTPPSLPGFSKAPPLVSQAIPSSRESAPRESSASIPRQESLPDETVPESPPKRRNLIGNKQPPPPLKETIVEEPDGKPKARKRGRDLDEMEQEVLQAAEEEAKKRRREMLGDESNDQFMEAVYVENVITNTDEMFLPGVLTGTIDFYKPAKPSATSHDGENVKVFRKQKVPGRNEHFELAFDGQIVRFVATNVVREPRLPSPPPPEMDDEPVRRGKVTTRLPAAPSRSARATQSSIASFFHSEPVSRRHDDDSEEEGLSNMLRRK